MNSKQYLAERKRLQEQKDLATKHGDTKLAESIGRRMTSLQAEHKVLVGNDTLTKFSTIAEARRKALTEDVDRITNFISRLADDLGVYPSTTKDFNSQTDKIEKIAPTASKGTPIYLWVGEMLVAMLSFSRDGSSVKAVFDDESDKKLIRAYKLAKDEFYEEVDEASKLEQVRFNASFSSSKTYEKAVDFTLALEKFFGASAFQTHEDGTRSFMVDESGMRRLEAFMKREGIEVLKDSQESPAISDEPAQDEESGDDFTLTVDMVKPELDNIAKLNGDDTAVTFFRLSKTNQISFRVGEFDGRGDKRPQDMHAKVTASTGDNSKAAKSVVKHFSKIKFQRGESLEGLSEAVEDTFDPEFAKQLQDVWLKHFKKGRAAIRKGALGDDSFFLRGFLIGDQNDQASKIWDNDPILHSFSFEDLGDDKVLMERSQANLATKPPEDSHLAMGRIKVPFRKAKGDKKKIVAAFEKYVAKLRKLVADNEDDIFGRDRIPDKYFESITEMKTNEDLIIVKGKDINGALESTLKAGYMVTPASDKGNNGGPTDDLKKVRVTMLTVLQKEGQFVMSISKKDSPNQTSAQVKLNLPKEGGVSMTYFGMDSFKKTGSKDLDKIWNGIGKKVSEEVMEASNFIAWVRSIKKDSDRDLLGSSFASGSSMEKLQAMIDEKLPEIKKNSFARGAKEVKVTITKGANQDIVDTKFLSESNKNVSEEMTQKEAVALAKKAMKAPDDQKEALMKILNNVGYNIVGKKLIKGDTEVTIEAVQEAREVLAENSSYKVLLRSTKKEGTPEYEASVKAIEDALKGSEITKFRYTKESDAKAAKVKISKEIKAPKNTKWVVASAKFNESIDEAAMKYEVRPKSNPRTDNGNDMSKEDINRIVAWFSNKFNLAVGWVLSSLSEFDENWLMQAGVDTKDVYRSHDGRGNTSIVRINPKTGTYAFIDNSHLEKTDEVKFEKMVKYSQLVIDYGKEKSFGLGKSQS